MFKKSRGFTLVELLIVVVVIAILAALTVVAYNGVQRQAREASVLADLRNASESVKLALLNSPTLTALPSDVKASKGIVLRLTNHTGYEDAFCINGYITATGQVYSNRPLFGTRPGLCPAEGVGSAVGGTFPEAIYGINTVSYLGDWKLVSGTGATLNSDKTEFSLTPGVNGTYTSPTMNVTGSTSVTVKINSYATQTSTQYASQSRSGVHTGAAYYGADGTTSVNNSGGYPSNGNAPSSIINSWQPYTTTYPTGPNVRYIRITLNSSNYTSNNKLKDFEVIINK